MVLHVVLVATINVLNTTMAEECPIVEKGQLIIELLVSEISVVDHRADKDRESSWLLHKYNLIL